MHSYSHYSRRHFLKTTAATLILPAGAYACADVGTETANKPVGGAESPILLKGDATTAYRDPAVVFHDGVFRMFYTLMRREQDGLMYWYLGVSKSTNLTDWTEPKILSPKDQALNFSSPGNIIRFGDEWVICLQTYPTPNQEVYGNQTARVWIRRSKDLENWGPPELLRVKGPDVPVADMGRMIDPYLVEDLHEPGKWWCFFKANGASMAYSYDLETWTYHGNIADAGENVCVLRENNEYLLFHSPANGIGIKKIHRHDILA